VAGKSVDYRTDIYSLGLILYEMFTGSQAFQAVTAVAIALKQMRETPPAPHIVEPSVPIGVERVILKCLEKEPTRRYQTVAELSAALRAPAVMGSNPSALTPNPVAATPARIPAPVPMVPVAARTEPKHRSPLPWIFLILLAAAATWGGMRAKAIWDQADQVTAPNQSVAPKPPEIAAEKIAEPPVVKKPPVSKPTPMPEEKRTAPVPTQVAETKPAVTLPPAPSKSASENSKPANSSPFGQQSLEAQQQRSEKILAQDESPDGDNNKKMYLWIGRFQKEDGAQKAAKKLEDLGQPAVVLPRHNDDGEFFVVFTGPFPGSRVPSVTQWLESQGFRNVRPVRSPFSGNSGGKPKDHQSQ